MIGRDPPGPSHTTVSFPRVLDKVSWRSRMLTFTQATRTPYLPQAPDPRAPLRLFCFHHAGGTAAAFSGWQRLIGDGISVVPVQLPGRAERSGEPRPGGLAELAALLDAELDPWLRSPHAFYGHSVGGLVAHALARHRAAAARSVPERLVVGGCFAPHRHHVTRAVTELGERDFARWLVRLGGVSAALIEYPQWLRAAVALTRDDLALAARPDPGPLAPLPCPVDVFTGENDPQVREGEPHEWARYTSGAFSARWFPGGHFFPWDDPAAFLGYLGARLGRRTERAGGAAAR
ncbi:thioesterase [Streptomyces sp. PT12]|nr:thioesterase [Streptomyces sp. PT12]